MKLFQSAAIVLRKIFVYSKAACQWHVPTAAKIIPEYVNNDFHVACCPCKQRATYIAIWTPFMH